MLIYIPRPSWADPDRPKGRVIEWNPAPAEDDKPKEETPNGDDNASLPPREAEAT